MAHDERLAGRLRAVLSVRKRVTEREMFGGVCFMLRDHMLCGVGKPGYMFRVGVDRESRALRRRGARIVDFNGRRMHGFIWVDPARCGARELRGWIALAEAYVSTLPTRKKPRKKLR